MTYSPIAIFGLHDNFYCLNLLLLHPIAFFQEMDFRMEEKKGLFMATSLILTRQMKVIKQTGNHMTAVLNNYNSSWVFDPITPDLRFYLWLVRFESKPVMVLKCSNEDIDYAGGCPPFSFCVAPIRLGRFNQACIFGDKSPLPNVLFFKSPPDHERNTGKCTFTFLKSKQPLFRTGVKNHCCRSCLSFMIFCKELLFSGGFSWWYASRYGNNFPAKCSSHLKAHSTRIPIL
jgi:hypothetical protein